MTFAQARWRLQLLSEMGVGAALRLHESKIQSQVAKNRKALSGSPR